MNRLLKIARQSVPGSGILFVPDVYGTGKIGQFLRDVLSLANASVTGCRYIVVGVDFNAKGGKKTITIDREDFCGKPNYQSVVADFIEPPVQLSYQPITVDGKRVGIFEIGECLDRPYMMRIDHSEKLRRGDAYMRLDEASIKMGRRQLQDMFHRKFRDAVPIDNIEIGFPGEIVRKEIEIPAFDLSMLPSAIAGGKLQQMMDIRKSVQNSGSTTVMARLTHARLFGSDSPYEHRSAEELMREMSETRAKHADADKHFLFEERAQQIQLVVTNQGEKAIEDASITLVMPTHAEFHIADCLPKRPRNDTFVARTPTEQADYPSVNAKDDNVQVSTNLGRLLPDVPVEVFSTPLRVCIGKQLTGRKMGIRYSLFGSNLQRPAKGKLKLLFSN